MSETNETPNDTAAERRTATYPPDVHPVRVPAGHRIAGQWEHPGGIVHEVWFDEEAHAFTLQHKLSIAESENAALRAEAAQIREALLFWATEEPVQSFGGSGAESGMRGCFACDAACRDDGTPFVHLPECEWLKVRTTLSLPQATEAHKRWEAIRGAMEDTAACLLSYTGDTGIARSSPLFYELMREYGTRLRAVLSTEEAK